MTRKNAGTFGAAQRGHFARVRGRRFDLWASSSPLNAEKARDIALRDMGWSERTIALAKTTREAAPAVAPTPELRPPSVVAGSDGRSFARAGSAAKAAMLVTAATSTMRNVRLVHGQHKTARDGLKETAADVTVAGLSAATIALGAEAIKRAAQASLPGVGKTLARGSAPAVLASSLLEMGSLASRGELTRVKAAETVGRNVCTAGAAQAGGAAGLVVGGYLAPITGGASLPICAIAGAVVAGIGGTAVFNRFSSWLRE